MAYLIPLESNPEVMNKFLRKIGVPSNVQVVDVFSLEPDMLGFVPQPVLALLLLFPDDDEYEEQRKQQEEELAGKEDTECDKVFYMKQIVNNACGTIALIHSIANVDNLTLDEGPLKRYLREAKPLNPAARGELLERAQDIIKAHEEAAAQGQTAPPPEDEPVLYHFIAFVEKGGSLYELDGSKRFPINHGPSSSATFLHDAAAVCQELMKRNPGNVNFTVCAVTAEE